MILQASLEKYKWFFAILLAVSSSLDAQQLRKTSDDDDSKFTDVGTLALTVSEPAVVRIPQGLAH